MTEINEAITSKKQYIKEKAEIMKQFTNGQMADLLLAARQRTLSDGRVIDFLLDERQKLLEYKVKVKR